MAATAGRITAVTRKISARKEKATVWKRKGACGDGLMADRRAGKFQVDDTH
jgi:hypothetical protein